MTVQFFSDPREEVFSLAGNSPLPLYKRPHHPEHMVTLGSGALARSKGCQLYCVELN